MAFQPLIWPVGLDLFGLFSSNGQVEDLQRGLLGGEVPATADRLPEPGRPGHSDRVRQALQPVAAGDQDIAHAW
jgi:hypothetical protein